MAAQGEGDDVDRWGALPPPDDRLWRHPSELAHTERITGGGSLRPPRTSRPAPHRGRRAMVASGVGASLTLLVLASTGVLLGTDVTGPRPPRTVVATTLAPQAVVEAARPSVLAVRAVGHEETTEGSAVVVRSDGFLVTSASVVAGSTDVEVTLPDGRQATATIVGHGADNPLALLHVGSRHLVLPRPPPSGTAAIGAATIAVRGIGNDLLGSSDAPVTISAMDVLDATIHVEPALAPSYRGAGLFDTSGRVLALCVPTTGTPSASPVRLAAVPWAQVVEAARPLLEDVDVTTSWLGALGRPLPAEQATRIGAGRAMLLTAVKPRSIAAGAGLRAGDVVLRVGGTRTGSPLEAVAVTESFSPGRTMVVAYLRNGQMRRTEIDPTPATTVPVR